MVADNKQIAQRFYAALNQRDVPALRELTAAEFRAHVSGMPGPLDREAYLQTAAMMGDVFDLHLVIEGMLAEGDRVATRFRERGIHQSEFMGVPATGRAVEYTGIIVDHLRDGKLVEHWVSFDVLGIMQQIGAIPGPGQPAG